MKKIFTFIVLFVVSLYSMAQTPFFYEWKNGYCTRRYLSDVDSITFDSNQKPFDSTTYDRLSGAWKMEVVSDYNGPLTFDVTVYTDVEGGPAYGKYCLVTGLSGYSFMTARLDCHFDESTGEGYVAFPMPYVSVESVNFGSFIGDIHLYGVNENNQLLSSASIRGVWNDDMSEITFEATPKMGMVIFVYDSPYTYWDRFVVVKMVKTTMKYNTMNLALSGGNVCSDNSVAITPNEVITTSIKRAETAFMDSSVNNWRPDTFEVISKNETKDDAATVNMDKERRTSKAVPQSQYFYEWNNGRWFQRSLAEVDSITFSLPDSSTATCKEVNEAPDGKCFVVSGTITKIANTTYGNWYMTDGTAELYIYGTLDAAGQTKNFTSLGLEVGDKVTIEGPKSTYNGSAQMVDVTVKKIEKALLKIVTDPIEISKEGGEFEVKLATKGKGAYFNISEECQEWVSYENVEYKEGIATKLTPNPADTIIYTFNALPNDASARTGAINFFANEGEPIAYTFTQAGGITDVTIAEFLAAEVNDAAQYRIVGHVTGFNKYNNNFYVKDWSGEVYAYYVETQGIKNIAIGDFVTLVGKRAEYNGTPQMPKGTLLEKYTASPEVSVAEFLTKEDSKEVYYVLTGTIAEIKNAQYGNINLMDANGDIVYVYGLLPGYGATGADKQGLVEAKGLKVGDTLTIVGNKASYKGDHQVGNAVYLSHESK